LIVVDVKRTSLKPEERAGMQQMLFTRNDKTVGSRRAESVMKDVWQPEGSAQGSFELRLEA